uniref:Conserved oligomeric Golgi complex subunit 5 n=1 Tax=Panagrolaimus sp. JU765 TaxID=591449 RepID=A0AC34PWL9_9BILA
MISTKEIEEYVNGGINEHEFLMRVAKDTDLDDLNLLNRVESVAASLNLKLRHEVGSNLNRLVEQAGSIDTLDSMQKLIHNEVKDANKEATELGRCIGNNTNSIVHSNTLLQRLSSLDVILSDLVEFEKLIKRLPYAEFSEKADIAVYLRKLSSLNSRLTDLQLFSDKFKPIVDRETRSTKQTIVTELHKALEMRNYTTVKRAVTALRAMDNDFAENEFAKLYKKGIEELDVIFIALGTLESAEEIVAALNHHKLKEKLCDWFEKLRMIDIELLSRFADRLGQIINIRMSNASPSVIHILRILHSCANEQVSVVSKPIKHALIGLDNSYLNHCYERLTKIVDTVFSDKNAILDNGCATIQGSFDGIIEEVKFDKRLEDLVKKRVIQALHYTVQQADVMLNSIPQDYRYGRRISNNQQLTYSILNLVYYLGMKYDFKSSVPAFLENYQVTILKSIYDTVQLVLGAMFEEHENNCKLKDDVVSPYMLELCGHLTTFGIHFDQLVCFSSQMLPGMYFVNYIFDSFLLHISLLRPINQATAKRCSIDAKYLLNTLFKVVKNPLSTQNLKAKRLIPNFLQDLPDSLKSANTLTFIPPWFVINLIIGLPPASKTPYEFTGWTRQKYTEWFCNSSDMDHYQFLNTYLIQFEKSVTKLPPYYDVTKSIMQKWSSSLTKN